MDLSLVFPCYMEEPHLEFNIERVLRLLRLSSLQYEIILVNDLSPDGTGRVADLLAKKHPDRIRVIHHPQNYGRGQAFMTGVEASRGDIVGFFDVDLEVSPVYLFECVDMLRAGDCEMVVGKRIYKTHLGLIYRQILSVGYSHLVAGILGIPTDMDSESGYKFFKRSIIAPYVGKFLHKGWFWDTEVVTRFVAEGVRVKSVPCLFLRNEEKRTTVKPLRDSLEYLYHLIKFKRDYRIAWAMGTIRPTRATAEPTPLKKAA